MSVFNPNGLSTVNVDDSGGTPRNITPYVKEIDGLEKLYDMKDATALADTSEKRVMGIQLGLTLTVRGDYNDAATVGPHVVFTGILGGATTRTVTVVLDGVKQYQFEALCTRYAVSVRNKELLGYEATLVSDGAVTIS